MGENNNLDLPFKMPPFCELLGIEVVEIGDDGSSLLTMSSHEKLWQPYGVLHGGSIFTLADAAAAYALAGTVERAKQFVTVEMKINYLAPVKDGIVEARARLLKGGRVYM
jgi:acyl-CoA thioesterase